MQKQKFEGRSSLIKLLTLHTAEEEVNITDVTFPSTSL